MSFKVVFAVLGAVFILTNCSQAVDNVDVSLDTTDTVCVDSTEAHRISLLFAGDLMQHQSQITAALQSDSSYNYDKCFAMVRSEIERADFAIVNFETTLGGPPYTGYPRFSAPDALLQASSEAGFDIFLTANNHCLDKGQYGFERTIKVMDSLGVFHVGTYLNEEERDDKYPFLLEYNNFRIVLLNFTYGTNGLKVKNNNMVNYMDTVQIIIDLEKAKQMQADAIIACPHWGEEYHPLPTNKQRQMAKWLFEHGVNYIIGSHPHVVQPIELYADSSHLVVWSMGNLISNMTQKDQYGGYMVRLDLTKKDSVVELADAGYFLYWVNWIPRSHTKPTFCIMPFNMADSSLTAYERRKQDEIAISMRQLLKDNNCGNIHEYYISLDNE